VADWYKDTKLDVLAVNRGSGTLTVQRGNGKGQFTNDLISVAVGDQPVAAVMGDFNKDLKQDIAVANAGSLDVRVAANDNAGTFAVTTAFALSGVPASLAAGDFNKDMRTDLAVAIPSADQVQVWVNAVSGWSNAWTLQAAAGSQPTAVLAVDLNKDTKLDLVVANSGTNTVSVYFGNGKLGFSNAVDYVVGDMPMALASADFDGNKLADLVVANMGSDDVTVLTNAGRGILVAAGSYGVGEDLGMDPSAVAVADLNRDGKLDVLTTLKGVNALYVMNGKGAGQFNFYWGDPSSLYEVGAAPVAVSVGDLNKDMSLDAVVANSGTNTVTLLLNNYMPMAYKGTVLAREDSPIDITLQGTYGPLDYVVTMGPTNGTFTIEGGYEPVTNGAIYYVATNTPDSVVLHYTPLADRFGNDVIKYYVTDTVKSSKVATVAIKIAPVNDAPSFELTNLVVETGEEMPVKFTNFVTNVRPGPAGELIKMIKPWNESNQTMKFLVTVPDESLWLFNGAKKVTNVVVTSSNTLEVVKVTGLGLPTISTKGLLAFTPAKNAFGTAPVTVQLLDGGGVKDGGTNLSVVQNFTIVITNREDAPTISKPMGKTMLEDGVAMFQVTVGDVESAVGDLVVTVTSTNEVLVPSQPATNIVVVVCPTNAAMRDIYVYPAADQYGKTLLWFTVTDLAGAHASVAATLTVNGVNDAPSFTLLTSTVTGANNALVTVPVIASSSAGAFEVQGLAYVISNPSPLLFKTQPAIDPVTGVLKFQAKSTNTVGSVTLSVKLTDKGGLLVPGSVNESPAQDLTITLQAP
jgi:hypothetical protein